ncbi:MAG: NAD(P)-dependent alcohol dehydrogenase [Deltaproteobacteria bacterium]|nr:NAD(P)-dependent alcohol dehydrogenase [Deltaproteobacteria bacterium]
MYAVELREFGIAHLHMCERPAPTPGPEQVLVRVRAASLNYRDLMMIQGRYNPKQPLPLVPLSDGAGEVVAVGSAVDRVRVGDRVVGLFSQKWFGGEPTREQLRATLGGPLDGSLQELWVLHQDGVAKFPEHMSFREAATLPCAALTAWTALVDHGHVQPGETVLLQGTGGVSVFALQIAKLAGARCIVTSSSPQKRERAEQLGAWQTVDYREDPNWHKTALALTGGRGVDHVVEVGGAGTLAKSLLAVRGGGHVAVIGVLSGGAGELPVTAILMNALRIQGVLVGHRQSFEAMCRAFEQAELRPVVDQVFSWRDLGPALQHMEQAQHFGKIVLDID